MSVRAKFFVTNIDYAHVSSGIYATVKLAPVYNNAPENKSWSEATPCGEIKLSITNPAAVDAFSLGKNYYIDFTPAEAA